MTAKELFLWTVGQDVSDEDKLPIINVLPQSKGLSDYLSVGRGILYFIIVISDQLFRDVFI